MTSLPVSFDPHHLWSVGSSSLVTSVVPVFDGSSITNPVVKSTAYWVNLKAQLVIILASQLLAAVVFAVVVAIAIQNSSIVLNEFDASSRLSQSAPREGSGITKSIDLSKLAICIAIDLAGSASELVPIYGEVVDVLFAPFAAYQIRTLFGGSNVAFFVELAEEILPFTDVLPFATICWGIETFAAQCGQDPTIGCLCAKSPGH